MVVLLPQTWSKPGAHNNNEEEEGKGRSTKCPREILKFQIFPKAVALLSLEQWRNAHGANHKPLVDRVSSSYDGHEKLVTVFDAWETL